MSSVQTGCKSALPVVGWRDAAHARAGGRQPARRLLARAAARAHRSSPAIRSRSSIPDGMWMLDSGEQLVPRDPKVETGHALMGPIEVRGARAGQVLVVQVDSVRPGRTGVTFTEPPHLIRWELDGDVGRGGGRSVRLAPFLGVMGMPPPEAGFHSTHPPRRVGRQHRLQGARGGNDGVSCRSRSTARCSRAATATPPRATARSRARRSSAPSRRS